VVSQSPQFEEPYPLTPAPGRWEKQAFLGYWWKVKPSTNTPNPDFEKDMQNFVFSHLRYNKQA
jgi:hypothetical protein